MSDTDSPSLPNSFEEAERFQRLFVQPLVAAVQTEMKTHVADVTKIVGGFSEEIKTHESRLGNLEKNQKKARTGRRIPTLAHHHGRRPRHRNPRSKGRTRAMILSRWTKRRPTIWPASSLRGSYCVMYWRPNSVARPV